MKTAYALANIGPDSSADRILRERGGYNPAGEWTQPVDGHSRYRIK